MKNSVKYAAAAVGGGGAVMGIAYLFPERSFIAFVVGWLFLLPAVFVAYMVYGLWSHLNDRKNRISVMVKPTEAMKALARRETALMKEKEILYEELHKEIKH